MATTGPTLDNLINSRERALFAVMVVAGVLLYSALLLFALSDATVGGAMVFYGVLIALAAFFGHGIALGRIRGNGVLVHERQFPELHRLVVTHAQRLGMTYSPTVYVVESGGVMNAFAMKMLGRKFIIINADVLSMALRRGGGALSFIVGHELGHHWRRHLSWRWLIGPARLVPYLGSAYSRACEYTCDRVGAFCEPAGAIDGLLVLSAGGWMHAHVNAQEFATQAEHDKGFWIRRAELVSSHPRLPRRVAALLAFGVVAPATEAITTSAATA